MEQNHALNALAIGGHTIEFRSKRIFAGRFPLVKGVYWSGLNPFFGCRIQPAVSRFDQLCCDVCRCRLGVLA